MGAMKKIKPPVHPGGFVKTKVIDALGISVTDAAQALGVTRPALSKLLNERAHLSPEMALRLEKAFGMSMDKLMQMQNSFDIAEARKRERDINVLPFKGGLLHGHAKHAMGGGQ
jgi:addiction module HigA family antidote